MEKIIEALDYDDDDTRPNALGKISSYLTHVVAAGISILVCYKIVTMHFWSEPSRWAVGIVIAIALFCFQAFMANTGEYNGPAGIAYLWSEYCWPFSRRVARKEGWSLVTILSACALFLVSVFVFWSHWLLWLSLAVIIFVLTPIASLLLED